MAQEFKIGRLRFEWSGPWQTGYLYAKDDVVSYQGKTYVCLLPHTSDPTNFYTNSSNWTLILDGKTFRGNWAQTTFYSLGNIVKFGGISYSCITPHTSGTTLTTDVAKWAEYTEYSNWRVTWGINTEYAIGDVVRYGGILYDCTVSHTSAANTTLGLEADQSKWSITASGVQYAGTWTSGVRYKLNDVVRVGGNLYKCTTYHTAGALFESANWTSYIPDQAFLSTWSPIGVYQINDITNYGGNLYISLTANNLNLIPSTNAGNWSLLAPGYSIPSEWFVTQSYQIGQLVTRNGTLLQALQDNIGQDPVAFSVSTTYNSSGSSGTTFKVASTTGATVGTYIISTGFTSGQAVNQVVDATTIILNYPPDSTPVNAQAVSFVGINYLYWRIVTPSTYWTNKWTASTVYIPGDLVLYKNNTHRCIQSHTSNGSTNRPDLDTTNSYWVEAIAHARKNVMSATGDVAYYNSTINGYSALAVGTQGFSLRSTNNTPEWSQINTVPFVVYVADKIGVDAVGYGSSWDKPYKSIGYACARVSAGTASVNAAAIIRANKVWIQAEMIAWTRYQIANNLTPFTTSYVLDSTKAARDAGFIIEGIAYDLSRAGNSQTVANAKAYFAFGSTNTFFSSAVQASIPYYLPMMERLRLLIQNAILQTSPGASYQTLMSVARPVTQKTGFATAEGGADAGATVLISYITTALTNGNTTLLPTDNQGVASTIFVKTGTYYETLPISIPANCGVIGDELRGVVVIPKTNITGTVTATTTGTNLITATNTVGLVGNMPIQFGSPDIATSITFNPIGGQIVAGTTYYVVGSTITSTQFSVAASPTTTFTGTFNTTSTTISDVSTTTGLAVGASITGTGIQANTTIVSIVSAPSNSSLYSIVISNTPTQNLVNSSLTATGATVQLNTASGTMSFWAGDCVKDMFQVRNGTSIRNMTLTGLQGTLKAGDADNIQRPSGGSFVAFDPGTGPNDSSVWIVRRSPFMVNVTTFGNCATGAKIDGTLHNGGAKSIVANDFTQVIQDGVGVWCTGPAALTELVSVFTYYAYAGYLAEDGGRIRATNGNTSYGTYGVVSLGYDLTETPVTGTVYNQSRQVQATVQSSLGAGAQIIKFNYANSGTNYLTATTNLLKFSNAFTGAAWQTDGNIEFDKVGIAPTGYTESYYLTGLAAATTSYIFQDVTIAPAGAIYTNIPSTTISGIGAAATFNVTITSTAYVVTVNQGGSGYVQGNQVYILGSVLGGVNVTNDLILTVNTVSGSTILSVVSAGTVPLGSALSYTVSAYIKQGTATQFDLQAIFSGSSTRTSSLNYNFATGTVTPSAANSGFLPTQYGAILTTTPGWYRLWMAVNDTSGLNTQIQVRIYPKGVNGTTGLLSYIYGTQLEKSSQPGNEPGFYLETSGGKYTAYANFNIQGAGIGASVIADELRSNGVFQSLVYGGGTNYLTASNQAQGGTNQYVTLSQSDVNSASNYIGMRVFLSSGTGAGQYGFISSYNALNKRASVLREGFDPLQVTSTDAGTGSIGFVTNTSLALAYVNMPVQFIPVYYATTVTGTSLAQTTVTAVTGGTSNTLTVSSTLGLQANMAVNFTGTMFGGVTVGYIYFVYAVLNATTIQISTQSFGTIQPLVSSTGSMTLNFSSGTGYLQASTTNMVPNLPIQFTGAALGGLTIGTSYYICDVINSNNFTLSTSTLDIIATETSASNNGITVSSTSGLVALNPIVFAQPTIINSSVVDSTKYYISRIIDVNTFTISSSIIQQTVSATNTTTNAITTVSTSNFVANHPIVFTGTSFGGIQSEVTYYVLGIISSTAFTVSQTQGGGALSLATATGNMILRTCPSPVTLGTASGSMTATTPGRKQTLLLGQGTMNAQFSTSLFGGVVQGTTYYVTSVTNTPSAPVITISDSIGGTNITVLTKTGTMNMGAVGWDHVTPGSPIPGSLDSTTVYFIEPRPTFLAPLFHKTTAGSITLPSLPGGTNWASLNYGAGLWMALPDNYSTGATSTNGITWTQGNLPFNAYWSGVAYGDGTWVAINSNTLTAVYTNSTGAGWRTSTLPATGFTDLVYGNGVFVAIASGTTNVAYSTNYGSTWTLATLPLSRIWTSITYGAGIFLAVCSGATSTGVYSLDGINWLVTTLPSAGWTSVTFGNGRFVAVSDAVAKKVAYCFDTIDTGTGLRSLTTWYESNVPIIAKTISYGNGVFLAVGSSTTAYQSENCYDWVPRTVNDDAVSILSFGFTASGAGLFIAIGLQGASAISAGTRAKARPTVTSNAITSLSMFEPGSGYVTGIPGVSGTGIVPTITLTDPNLTSLAVITPRLGSGTLGAPTFINKGSGYNSTTTTVAINGNGFADAYQIGYTLILNNLTALPDPGSNLEFANGSTSYKVTSAVAVYGTVAPNIQANLEISPALDLTTSPANGVAVSIRTKYSQARLTGHDFLDIGYGNLQASNYPSYNPDTGYASLPQNQTIESNFGRVFYTSTDQDGNFKVGSLFGVQQATGVVTLSASQFGLSGLSTISLGGISVGGSSVTITQFSTDGTFTANSDSIIPTQRAIRTYLASRLSQGGSNTYTGQLTAGTVVVGGTNQIRSSIPNGQSGSVVKVTSMMRFAQIPNRGTVDFGVDGNLAAFDFFYRHGTRRSVPPLNS